VGKSGDNSAPRLTGKARVVTAKRVLTGYDDAGAAQFMNDAALVLSADRIERVIPAIEVPAGASLVAEYPDHVLIPGLVNAHHHVGITPLQAGSLDHHLEEWIGAGAVRRGLDPYLDTLFSAVEMVCSGVTCVQHISGISIKPASSMRHFANEVLRAYRDIGMRASFCFNSRDQNHMSHESDAELVARAAGQLKADLSAYLTQGPVGIPDYLELFDTLTADVAQDHRLAIQLAPANLHWCSDQMLIALRDKASSANVTMHMHLVETPYQAEYARRRTGKSAIAHLADLGLLGPRMTLGHGVWISPGDMDLLAQSGTSICHNCSSNLRLGSGRAPVTDYLDRGLTVALGIDEAGVNDDRDMWLEMRMALYQHRDPGIGARWPSASEVMRAATVGGGETTPFGTEIGRLAPGAWADFTVIDWSRATWPYQDANVPLINVLVQRVKPDAITAVWVAGDRIVSEGRPERIDVEAIHGQIASHLSGPRDEVDQRGLRIANGVPALIRDFFTQYDFKPKPR
jgi:5-methylthioadenosine/S-adenosylhomocysteine deaminase